jgi:hypothetical protein
MVPLPAAQVGRGRATGGRSTNSRGSARPASGIRSPAPGSCWPIVNRTNKAVDCRRESCRSQSAALGTLPGRLRSAFRSASARVPVRFRRSRVSREIVPVGLLRASLAVFNPMTALPALSDRRAMTAAIREVTSPARGTPGAVRPAESSSSPVDRSRLANDCITTGSVSAPSAITHCHAGICGAGG